ncbi:MAG TPA: lipoyl(octanoyl) transferase LipB [Candidatus Kapabacteria bacterium]|nr:lipoyl(octanoyl) transferase LipB [Candidatus Kapabacteria bacterium]
MADATRTVQLLSMPLTNYRDVWDLQHQIFSELIEGKPSDTLILCEHPPVYTLGRVTDEANILFSNEELAKIGAEKFEIERGGDVTFHGPGQLVGYPLLNLSHFKEDLGWYLRSLEEVIIQTLASYKVNAFRIPGRTGVWVGTSPNEKKICAIGIKASRWCTMHGFAFNINTDLRYFEHIVPCGIGDRKVTSLAKELEQRIEVEEVKRRVETYFEKVFEITLLPEPKSLDYKIKTIAV